MLLMVLLLLNLLLLLLLLLQAETMSLSHTTGHEQKYCR
jgi:hypothetical protein